MPTFQLINGKPIDEDMVETVAEINKLFNTYSITIIFKAGALEKDLHL